jgi:hypothetical protein
MIRIRYNISTNKKIDFFRFFWTASLLFIISAFFLFGGYLNFSSKDKILQTELKKLKDIKDKLSIISENSNQYKEERSKIEKLWKKKIDFANSLITRKSHSFIKRLNILEELLPAGVHFSQVGYTISAKNEATLNVVSYSYSKLAELYAKLFPYKLEITSEVEKNGCYQASLKIKIKDEKN